MVFGFLIYICMRLFALMLFVDGFIFLFLRRILLIVLFRVVFIFGIIFIEGLRLVWVMVVFWKKMCFWVSVLLLVVIVLLLIVLLVLVVILVSIGGEVKLVFLGVGICGSFMFLEKDIEG